MKLIINMLQYLQKSLITLIQAVQLAIKKERRVHALKVLKLGNKEAVFHFLESQKWPYKKVSDDHYVLYCDRRQLQVMSCISHLERVSQARWTICLQSRPDLKQSRSEEAGFVNVAVDQLLQQAFQLHASSIFITVNFEHAMIQFRRYRTLTDRYLLPCEKGLSLIRSLLILGYLNIEETMKVQEGHFRYILKSGEDVFCRISYIENVGLYSLALRLLSEKLFPFRIENLRLPQSLLEFLNYKMQQWHSGMIIISGMTGSGKTTTLYAIGKLLRKKGRKIISLEDPIEAEMTDWLQTEITQEAGYTFDIALQAVLRQDSDVILIGEMRDRETAQAAFYASLSGYLVIATLHAKSLDSISFRCKELGICFAEFKDNIRLCIHQVWQMNETAPCFNWKENI